MEILKKTGKFLLGVVIGVAIMMFADRYYVKGKRLVADNLPKEPVEYVNPYMGNISHLLVPTYPTSICLTVCCASIPNVVILRETGWVGCLSS